MNKQNSVGSSFVDIPAPLNCLFLCKDSHWDVNLHIQPLIYFIGTKSLLLMSQNTSLEVLVSHSWDCAVTRGCSSRSSKRPPAKIRCTAKVADGADAGLGYGVVKVIKVTNCRKKCRQLIPSFPSSILSVLCQKLMEMSVI